MGQAHLVVDAVGPQSQRRVDPITQGSAGRIVDGVPYRPPLDSVYPVVARLPRIDLGALRWGVVRLDERRPGQAGLGVLPCPFHRLEDALVLGEVTL